MMPMRIVTISPSLHGLDGFMSAKDWHTVIGAAVARWNQALMSCCNVRLTMGEAQNRWLATEDGVNLVVLRRSVWCHNETCNHGSTFRPHDLAVTTVYPDGAKSAQVREGDVEINAQMLRAVEVPMFQGEQASLVVSERGIWALGPPSSSNPVPLEGVLLHELGHVLGLGDVCVSNHHLLQASTVGNCSVEQQSRVMFPDARQLHPTAADLAELAQIFPLHKQSASVPLMFSLAVIAALVGGSIAIVHWRRISRSSGTQ